MPNELPSENKDILTYLTYIKKAKILMFVQILSLECHLRSCELQQPRALIGIIMVCMIISTG